MERAAQALVVADQMPLLYLDANVLLPEYLSAIFLELADNGLVRVYWGIQVLAEVRRTSSARNSARTPNRPTGCLPTQPEPS